MRAGRNEKELLNAISNIPDIDRVFIRELMRVLCGLRKLIRTSRRWTHNICHKCFNEIPASKINMETVVIRVQNMVTYAYYKIPGDLKSQLHTSSCA